jgi:hypothetical protein
VLRKPLEAIAGEYEHIRTTFGGQSAILAEVKRIAVGASHSTKDADTMLKSFYGSTRMTETPATPKAFVVCSAVDVFPAQPYLFRNYGKQTARVPCHSPATLRPPTKFAFAGLLSQGETPITPSLTHAHTRTRVATTCARRADARGILQG